MGGVVSSTADVLAIIGGTTTLILGIFGAVRYSRCRSVSCCWGACRLTNAPPGEAKDARPTHLTFGPHPKRPAAATDESAAGASGPAGPVANAANAGPGGPIEAMSMSMSSTWNGASGASGASGALGASATMDPGYGSQGELDIQHV